MSFILDALRKSETARRRSEAPDLFATMPTASEAVRTRSLWPLWAVGIVGTLSLLLALWLFSQRTSSQRALVPEPSPVASETASEPTSDAAIEAADDTMPESQPPAFTPMPVATQTSSPLPPPPAHKVATAGPSAPPTAVPADNTPPPAASRVPDNASAPPALPEPPNASSQVPSTTATIAPPVADRPLALADLDPATRKQLPPLKLSMHLWNETASQRFVILDGQRLKEGDALGEIVVERISRDGAVLAWRGSRLKIELR
jgi:general secretion pathway protein B